MMKKREFLASVSTVATGLAAAFAAPATRASVPAAGPTLLTVTGAIGHGNRGALDPALDQMMARQKIRFDRAQAYDFGALAAMAPVRIRPTLEYDGKAHALQGPLLADVLMGAGVAVHQPHALTLRAIDGYTVSIDSAALLKRRYLVATHLDGRPLPLGGLGPLWAVFDADHQADLAQRPLGERYERCPWGLYHIDVQATQAVG
jgi:hypothetical protein